MKCISLWQPWATLWVMGVKIHETRHWPTNIRGTIAVHAAKRKSEEERDFANCEYVRRLLGRSFDELPFGAIVGTVDLVACHQVEVVYNDAVCRGLSVNGPHPNVPADWYLGNYTEGRFAWQAQNPIELRDPIPFKGAQGFFEVPALDVVRARRLQELFTEVAP